jgi:hypothetical protein
MNGTILVDERPNMTAASDIPRVLAAADAYLEERTKPFAPGRMRRALSAVFDFLKVVGQTNARQEMLAEARRIEASRPELAAQLRRVARGSWL